MTALCPPNDIKAVEKILREDDDIACVIIEPTGGGFGAIPTGGDFLKSLREVATGKRMLSKLSRSHRDWKSNKKMMHPGTYE